MRVICKGILQGREKKQVDLRIPGWAEARVDRRPRDTCQKENNRWIRERKDVPHGDEFDEGKKVGELS